MNARKSVLPLFLLIILGLDLAVAQAAPPSRSSSPDGNLQSRKIDRDLMEITIPKLENLYRTHQYTVTKVVGWYIERIERYNGIYGAVQTLDVAGALATAGQLDAEAKAGGTQFVRGRLWGVPVLTKANTSVQGLVTTDGWKGYAIPGLELLASRDATIIAKMRKAGAVILGQTSRRGNGRKSASDAGSVAGAGRGSLFFGDQIFSSVMGKFPSSITSVSGEGPILA
jgi:hypothetical protein